ncbi:hypothetical protein VTO42DRAFT_4780 [Malbranchea cinnamomea]
MSEGTFRPSARPGVLHHYLPKLSAFEHTVPGNGQAKRHSLLFVGGLSDGLNTVPYVSDLAQALESEDWSVFEVLLSSSYSGWGLSSLEKDVQEIAKCVEYVREYKASQNLGQASSGLIVLMGHSTGSQDVLHYLHSSNPLPSVPHSKRPLVDGAILQAPVSDREALLDVVRKGTENDSPQTLEKLFAELVAMAKANQNFEGTDFLLPLSMTKRIGLSEDVPISSRRFLSLASPDSPQSPREDDLFSSDLNDERLKQTFGMIGSRGLLGKSILVIPGGADEFVPASVDKEELLKRWEAATKQGGCGNNRIWDVNSRIIPNAKHSPSGESQSEQRQELVSTVVRFLKSLEEC